MNDKVEEKRKAFHGIGRVSEAVFNSIAIDCIFDNKKLSHVGDVSVLVNGDRKEDLETLAALVLAKLDDMEDEEA